MTRFNSDIEFVHGSGQVLAPTGDLTLRTDDLAIPRSVIIGSGATLRPERDAINRLGTPDLRWYDAWIGNLTAYSGVLGDPSLARFTWSLNGHAFLNSNVSFTDCTVLSDGSTVHTLEGATEFNTDGIVRFSSSSQFEMDTLMHPSVDNLGTIGQTARRFARIHGSSGIFNLLAPQSSGTFITVDGSLAPDEDAVYHLGFPTISDGEGQGAIRWGHIVGASGHFNAIYPQVSGGGAGDAGAWIEVGGSLLPPTHTLAPLYWLGVGKFNRWAGVDAFSGVFDVVTSLTMDIGAMDVGTLNIDANGDFINGGAFDWDLGAAQSTISNGTWAFDSTVDVEFDKRPTTLTSGVAMQDENYFEVYGGRNVSFANPATTLALYTTSDNTQLTPHDYYFVVDENVQIRNFSCETTHLGASPAPWALRLRIDDNGFDHASGMVGFHPTANVSHRHFGSLSGTQTIPAGSRCRFIFDSDGGAGHNTVFGKVFLGLTVVSGLQRGPQED